MRSLAAVMINLWGRQKGEKPITSADLRPKTREEIRKETLPADISALKAFLKPNDPARHKPYKAKKLCPPAAT